MGVWARDSHRVRHWVVRTREEIRDRWHRFEAVWRSSLQLRVVVSTLALSLVVVFVFGVVLQAQITTRLLNAKSDAAVAQAKSSLPILERELTAVDPNSDNVHDQLEAALNRLTTSHSGQSAGPAAGAFDPVLVDGRALTDRGEQPAAGPIDDVPTDLRRTVERGQLATKITTPHRDGEPVTMFAVGSPVSTATRPLQVYLLFPLSAEQSTVNVVHSTLLLGGTVLLALLGAITSLVTRQVVQPVRQAARTAEELAEGDLDKRMRVIGEDDMASLAESFNEMADSLKHQINQLEEFGQLQRRFTSDVSHELRTPLTTVRMAADVLYASRDDLPAGLCRSTELLTDELDRFEALLADLLEISRLDAGVADLSPEPLDLVEVAERAVSSVRGIAETSDVSLRTLFPEEGTQQREGMHVLADARRVERILRNLVANAIDHAEGEPVEVRAASNDRAVAVTVRDHGVGLRPGEAELVFTRFWRADPARNRRTGGTGLGLSISHEDARLHGGTLDAWGEPGNGSCFRLVLPRRPNEHFETSPLAMPDRRSIAAPDALLAASVDAPRDEDTPSGVERNQYEYRDQGPARLSEEGWESP